MPANKTILVLTRNIFPYPGIGAVRMTQWCRHLPEFGWKPVVLSRYYGHRATPEELARGVHPDVSVTYFDAPPLQTNQSEPRGSDAIGSRSIKHWIRLRDGSALHTAAAHLARGWYVPDVSIRFWRLARQLALAMLDEVSPAVILTTGPPHSNHDIGLWLKQQRPGVKWVADFRDPYLIDPRFGPQGLGKIWTGAHHAYERSIYANADLVTHAIPIQARWARLRYSNQRHKIKILTNGCPADLAERKLDPIRSEQGRLSIRVMGANEDQYRGQLARVAERLVGAGHDIDLCLIGKHGSKDEEFRASLSERFMSTGQTPHVEALRHLLGADVLVAVLDEKRGQVMGLSSKLFEFLACGKPIVIVNPTRPDRHFLRPYAGVRVLDQPDDGAMLKAIEWALSAEAQPSKEQTDRVCRELSRRSQVEALAGWLDNLV